MKLKLFVFVSILALSIDLIAMEEKENELLFKKKIINFCINYGNSQKLAEAYEKYYHLVKIEN